MGWAMECTSLGSTPGGDTCETRLKRRSTRLEQVSSKIKSEVVDFSIIGKRTREAFAISKENVLDAAKGIKRRTSTRVVPGPGLESTLDEAEPPKKKTRASSPRNVDGSVSSATLVAPSRQLLKKWLSRGLYVGQDRNFNPRLTEAKNKLKAAKCKSEQKQRKILPLPMFLGQRLLDVGRDFRIPFDVYNPLPPGQPRPDEWRVTRKNVFIGEAAGIWRHSVHPDEVSRCVCTPSSGCGEDCFNRFMFYECDENNCALGEANCTNRSFEELRQRRKAGGKYNVGVEVVRTEGKGYGVRSNRTFEAGQIIVEYTGEIITQEECDERMKSIYRDNECYYLMSFDQNMIIDATRGSIARFVNHSCAPNCKMVKWTVGGKSRMALFAGTNGIMTGEELTYDYNFDPFSVKNVQECRCGASACRGVLGPRTQEPKPTAVLSSIISTAKSAKRKITNLLAGESSVKDVKRRKLASAVTTNLRKRAKSFTASISRFESEAKKLQKHTSIRNSSSSRRTCTSTSSMPMRLEKSGSNAELGKMTSMLKPNSKYVAVVKKVISPAAKSKSVPIGSGRGKAAMAMMGSMRREMERSVRAKRRSAAVKKVDGTLGLRNGSVSTIRILGPSD